MDESDLQRDKVANILHNFVWYLMLLCYGFISYIFLTKTLIIATSSRLEVTLIPTVDIEDNKYYLNNIME